MPKLLYVPISDEALERLCQQAGRERRRPQDEAASLLEQALGLRQPPTVEPISGPSRAAS